MPLRLPFTVVPSGGVLGSIVEEVEYFPDNRYVAMRCVARSTSGDSLYGEITVDAVQALPGFYGATIVDYARPDEPFSGYCSVIKEATPVRIRCDSLDFPEFWWEIHLE